MHKAASLTASLVFNAMQARFRVTSAPALLMLAVCAGLPLSALAQSAAPDTPVIASRVTLERWSDPIKALGTLKADESVTLSATVTDVVTAIDFDDGDNVAASQRLFQLDDREEQAQLRAANARAAEQRNALNRFTQLRERNLSARADVEDSQARLNQAKADADALKARLANYRIKAPFSGRMGLRDISVGTLVTPGTELATLDKLDVMRLDFSVSAIYLAQMSRGATLRAHTDAFPEQVFQGEVASIGTRVDPVSRSVTVRARLENPEERLRPGMLMQVELDAATRDTLVVPESAIVSEGRSHYVWRLDENDANRLQRRQVDIGARRKGEVEILDGLERDDLIVAHGTEQVREGQTTELLGIVDDDTSIKALLHQERVRQGRDD
ncbi:MAG: efflux RND transporter periplasmic adaptor subunit [Halomonas sp.]|nr:efflux RND transporter periplasmic adaptor subunit [Halomonas sp.]MDN6297205.1 efflux RND transporter periplasmic adaptor subunit [Halomonas sp.]MDN6314293.1 efflux RND transporter periplasmic adaptor subunit [Halomonas sp.]MDN6335939.1 efflux RND transporter periplasmic adaptor subunit [Halomonas sp.]